MKSPTPTVIRYFRLISSCKELYEACQDEALLQSVRQSYLEVMDTYRKFCSNIEERYSDFTSALFGLDANRDHGFATNLKRAVQEAFAFDENGTWKWDQLVAEAAAFSVPM